MGPELTIKIIQICNIMFTLKMRPLAQALEAFEYQPVKQQIKHMQNMKILISTSDFLFTTD
uniref:Putative ovule protein n=1 Tax=Solanum chacoense TaxID=4108 RepID=A0A0V0HHM8_SOLCH